MEKLLVSVFTGPLEDSVKRQAMMTLVTRATLPPQDVPVVLSLAWVWCTVRSPQLSIGSRACACVSVYAPVRLCTDATFLLFDSD